MAIESTAPQFDQAPLEAGTVEISARQPRAAELGSAACQLCVYCSECRLGTEGDPQVFIAPRPQPLPLKSRWIAYVNGERVLLREVELDVLTYAAQQQGREFLPSEFKNTDFTTTSVDESTRGSIASAAISALAGKLPAVMTKTGSGKSRRYRFDPDARISFEGRDDRPYTNVPSALVPNGANGGHPAQRSGKSAPMDLHQQRRLAMGSIADRKQALLNVRSERRGRMLDEVNDNDMPEEKTRFDRPSGFLGDVYDFVFEGRSDLEKIAAPDLRRALSWMDNHDRMEGNKDAAARLAYLRRVYNRQMNPENAKS